MGQVQADTLHFNSFEEFLEFEKHSEIRYEFHNGEVFAMAGTTIVHNLLVGRMRDLIREKFAPPGCYTLMESVKLQAIKDYYYPYPDVMLTCNEVDKQERYIIKNPMLIVEVLSKSTADSDKSFKWQRYKKISSLQHYILVSQYEVLIEVFSRANQPETWLYRSFDNLTDNIRLEDMDFTLSIGAVYDGIRLAKPEENE
jgi:Uma2 family endonuclease